MKKTILLLLIIIITLFLTGCSTGRYSGFTAEEWAYEVSACEDELYDYRTALEEANSNIEQANRIIEDAQYFAGESYEDMEWALNNMSTVDTVSEPY
jgi:hypothetical protein